MKIGWIDYLNTMPFDFELTGVKPDINYTLIRGVPSQINTLFSQKKVDVGFISSAHYMENFNQYLIFPELSISSYNKVKSVIILSDSPLKEIDTIYLTGESKTSRYLTKVIFEKFFGKVPDYRELNGSIEEKKAVLLIGDSAIKYADAKKYRYDLSQIWAEKTGLPFVFALWCVHRDYYERHISETVKLWKALKDSKEIFFKEIDRFLTDSRKIEYLKNLDYCLTQEHIESLKLFGSYLKELGILKKEPQFHFVEVKDELGQI